MKLIKQKSNKLRGFWGSFLLLVMCGVIGAGCALPLQKEKSGEESVSVTNDSSSAEPVTIKVIHTNDIHGRSAYQEDSVVGFERLAALIVQEEPALVLDVGDTFHGQAFATMEEGAGMAELLKAIKYDAMTPGNHDWNYGKDRLKELEKQSGVPLLAANVTQEDSPFFANDGTFVKTVNGVKIGVLGVFDPVLQDSTAPRNIEGLSFADDAQKASELAEKLREQGCDIVIALSHQLYCDEFVARTYGIDLLLAGHEHVVMDESYPDADGKQVPVMETGSYFENVGLVSIEYDKSAKKILSITEALTDLAAAGELAPDKEVTAVLDTISARLTKQLTQVAGTTGLELDGRREELRVQETSMGRLVTAAYLEETGADIAFENAGGIRTGRLLPVGDITVGDVVDTAPFGNYIVTKEISGEAVRSILEKSIEIGLQNKKAYDEWKETGSDKVRWPEEDGNYLQFGGMTVVYDTERPKGERVMSARVGNAPLDPDQLYTVAANNYISLGKTYSELAEVPDLNQYSACDEALLRCIGLGQSWVDTAAAKPGLVEETGNGALQ